MSNGNAFEESKKTYSAELEQPWAKIMYEMLEWQLGKHLPQEGRLLSVGCGFGLLDRWAAHRGLAVTGVDVTDGLLEMAKEQADAEGLSIDYRAFNVETDDFAALEGPFDALACHNVLEYLKEPERAVMRFSEHVKPGGLLSLVNHNPAAKVLKEMILQQNPARALENLGRKEYHSVTIGTSGTICAPEDVARWLERAGFEVVARYGIRTVYDYVPNTHKFEAEWHEQMVAFEKAVCDKSPYRDMAMFTHWVARKK